MSIFEVFKEKNRCSQRFALFTEVYYKEHMTGIWELMHLSLNRWVKLCKLFNGTVHLMYCNALCLGSESCKTRQEDIIFQMKISMSTWRQIQWLF